MGNSGECCCVGCYLDLYAPPPPSLHLVNGTGNSPSPGEPNLE